MVISVYELYLLFKVIVVFSFVLKSINLMIFFTFTSFLLQYELIKYSLTSSIHEEHLECNKNNVLHGLNLCERLFHKAKITHPFLNRLNE